ncbi:MAG: hypothetical protein ACO37F_15155, partial [Pirellulales bacterium]
FKRWPTGPGKFEFSGCHRDFQLFETPLSVPGHVRVNTYAGLWMMRSENGAFEGFEARSAPFDHESEPY